MMLSKVVALALVASAAAQTSFSITSPGPQIWWVSDSLNTLSWSPCDATTQGTIPAFNVVVSNTNQGLLAGNLTILGNEPTFDCSQTITPTNIPVGAGYTMYLTSAVDLNKVYTITTFEMRAKGSTYPPPVSSSSSSSPTASNSASASSPTTKTSAASDLVLNLQGLLSAVLGAGVFIGLF